MKRTLISAVLLILFATESAHATFFLFRRPTETRYYYVPTYYTPAFYTPAYYTPSFDTPSYYAPSYFYEAPVIVPQPTFIERPIRVVPAPVFVQPPIAQPTFAPPSLTPEPPLLEVPRMPPATTTTTSAKVNTSAYNLYSAASSSRTRADRCSVAFWNLSSQAFTLRILGQTYNVSAGQSLTLELPHRFAWQVAGRDAEAASINPDHATAEILIRR